MATKRKQGKAQTTGSGRTVVRIGCFILIVTIAVCTYVFVQRPGPYIQRIFDYLAKKYPHVKEVGEKLSTPLSWEATLCFGDENSDYLIREYRKMTTSVQPREKAKALIEELISGPRAKGLRTIPADVRLRGVREEGDILIVDFSQDLITKHPGGSSSEMMTVFSIVNTVTINIPEYKRVRLLVEGKPIDTIAGHIDCKEPIAPQSGLVH